MQGYKKKFFILLFSAAFLCGSAYWMGEEKKNGRADHFSLRTITSHLAFNPEWEVPSLSSEEAALLHSILDQDFFFLGKGKQFFAFSDKEHKYVIKFLKCKRLEVDSWLQFCSSLPFCHSYYQKQSQRKNKRITELFSSCILAYTALKEETGLLYVHLNKSNGFFKPLRIHDKIGRTLTLSLDDHLFCVQRLATTLYSSIEQAKEKNDLVAGERYLDNLMALILSRHQKGIIDYDPFLGHNSGFVDGKPIHIDIGRFALSSWVKEPHNSHKVLQQTMQEFRPWLQVTYPELDLYLKKALSPPI